MMSTRFLPMSWTSPLTVASTMVPFCSPSTRSMCGSRWATAEQLAHHLHAVEQMDVDDVERRVPRQRLVELGLQPLPVALDDAVLEALLDRRGARPLLGPGGGAAGEE